MNVQDAINYLRSKHLTIAVAESCTGGLISKLITDVPGASCCFLGGCVTYSNASKISMLGVQKETLISYGAVSVETASEMAVGIKNIFDADIGLSTTGIAGPGGGTESKPVGTVCFGLAYGEHAAVWKKVFFGNRDQIRTQAAENAIGSIYMACDS